MNSSTDLTQNTFARWSVANTGRWIHFKYVAKAKILHWFSFSATTVRNEGVALRTKIILFMTGKVVSRRVGGQNKHRDQRRINYKLRQKPLRVQLSPREANAAAFRERATNCRLQNLIIWINRNVTLITKTKLHELFFVFFESIQGVEANVLCSGLERRFVTTQLFAQSCYQPQYPLKKLNLLNKQNQRNYFDETQFIEKKLRSKAKQSSRDTEVPLFVMKRGVTTHQSTATSGCYFYPPFVKFYVEEKAVPFNKCNSQGHYLSASKLCAVLKMQCFLKTFLLRFSILNRQK